MWSLQIVNWHAFVRNALCSSAFTLLQEIYICKYCIHCLNKVWKSLYISKNYSFEHSYLRCNWYISRYGWMPTMHILEIWHHYADTGYKKLFCIICQIRTHMVQAISQSDVDLWSRCEIFNAILMMSLKMEADFPFEDFLMNEETFLLLSPTNLILRNKKGGKA